jgi:hypothetical protein
MSPSHPPDPGAPRRTFSHASFSPRKYPQRSPLGEQAVLAAWGGRVRNATPPVLSSGVALLDGHFEHPAETFSCSSAFGYSSCIA